MPNRTRPLYEANRLARWLLVEMGRELRVARLTSGLRQVDVARQLGTSKSRICRVEHGQVRTLTLSALARHAAVVGLKPYIRLFPLGRRLLDQPQLDLLARFRSRLHPSWTWETEVPMPNPGDLRAGDARVAQPDCSVLIEAITRFADEQAQTRAARLKQRDLGATRLILLLSTSHANRRAVAAAGATTRASFPGRTKDTMAALAAGRDPGADAIVFL